MLYRRILALIIAVILDVCAFAADLITPPFLSNFSSSPVYSITQDSQGAMWFNTTSGVFRYNGHSLTRYGVPLSLYLSKFTTADCDVFYLNHPDGIIRFTAGYAGSFEPEIIAAPLPENSPIFAEGDSLLFARYNQICSFRDGKANVISSLNDDCHIRSFERLLDGTLLVATYESGIGIIDRNTYLTRLSINSRILDTHLSKQGILWIGTSTDGIIKVDARDFSVLGRYDSPDDKPMLDVRCFAEDRSGNLYFGAASGLFCLDCDGSLRRIPIDGVETNSVCDVFVDFDGNLWVSTYDNGVYFANLTSFPFSYISDGIPVGTPRGIDMTEDGTVWVASDPYGLLSYRDGIWSIDSTLSGFKFQSAYCDPATQDLFLGNWDGMVRYCPTTGLHKQILFSDDYSVGSRIPVFAVHRHCDDLYIGTTVGAFLFNPDREEIISRPVKGINHRINSIIESPDGSLIFAGDGLFVMSGGRVEAIEKYEDLFFMGLKQDSAGSIWAALSTGGIIRIDRDGTDTYYTKHNCGLPDVPISFAIPLYDGNVVAGTSLGISILDPETMSCRNYDRSNGLKMKSTSRGFFFNMPDGKILLGGNSAIEVLNPAEIPHLRAKTTLCFDSIIVNGKKYIPHPVTGTVLVLDHTSTNLRFDMANFDYSGVGGHMFLYKLDGADSNWNEFEISEPVSCMNLSPGHYRLRVRESVNLESVSREISIPITIMPVWYCSFPFIILWILLLLLGSLCILYSIYERKLLKRRLLLEEEENVRQSKFFHELSLRMRTPLNLMIGQIEHYFKEYGSRARGVEDIQDVYSKATHILGLISDFVDDSNERLENRPKYSKLLNEATGVVERNIFSGVLDVPLLCRELNMGKTKLTEALKEASGMTPREFIEEIRLQHALEMIAEGNHTVAEVSDNLGFSSPKYFAVKFKQKFGCPPSMYGHQ